MSELDDLDPASAIAFSPIPNHGLSLFGQLGHSFAMVATKVNAFIASLNPSDANRDLESYLFEATNALGLNSDADLARAMIVPPATLASWKRRGKLPAEQCRWFKTAFPVMVFNRWRSSIAPYSSGAVELVLAAIHEHYGNGLGDGIELKDASQAFGGLLVFVPMITHTYFNSEKDEAIDVPRDVAIKALVGALEWRAQNGL